MLYVIPVFFTIVAVLVLVRIVQRNRAMSREGAPATLLSWLNIGVGFALMLGGLGFMVAIALRADGVIAFDRNLDWWTLGWMVVGSLAVAILHMVDTWKRTRKLTRHPLLPPLDDDSSD